VTHDDSDKPVKHTALIFLARFGALSLLLTSPALAQRGDSLSPPIVLRGVTIVDVSAPHRDQALRRAQTVLISGNRIEAVGARIRIPPGATILDATGKFAIPGLWDMHVHIADPSYFGMFIANGVTGVRDMGGAAADPNDGCESIVADSLFAWRTRIQSGRMIGPRILMGGPAVSGTGGTTSLRVRTRDEARRAIDSLRSLHVDFVKVYEKIPLDAYRALLEEAGKARLPVAGHVPVETVTLVQAAKAGQRSIEHVRDHLLTCFTRDRNELMRFFQADHWSASDIEWGLARHRECETAVAEFRKRSTWLVPTLTVERAKIAVEEPRFFGDPARALLPRTVQEGFAKYRSAKLAQPSSERASEHLWWKTQKRLAGEMNGRGVGLLAGTDAACQGGIPGYSLHEELRLLVESGLTPLEALKTATVNPAKYQAATDKLGAIRSGHPADLVILDRNPLDDISNTKTIHSVVAGGRLLRRSELDTLLTLLNRQ
jgi:imidazolonepropionase-like amidohydrolase